MSDDPDLFAYQPPPKREETPLELGHRRAKEAADHAGDGWKTEAMIAFKRYAEVNPYMTSEAVRLANPEIVMPPGTDTRAWGHIAKAASKSPHFFIVADGYTNASDRKVHGNVVTRWRSLIFKGADHA